MPAARPIFHFKEIFYMYTTQMDAARRGIVTPQMEAVAKEENMSVDQIREYVA